MSSAPGFINTEISVAECKRLLAHYLDEHNLSYDKLTARTISFQDLARASAVFVKIHGLQPGPAWIDLAKFAKQNNFIVEAAD